MTDVGRMGPSYASKKGAATIRDTLRVLRARGLGAVAEGATLEMQRTSDEPPRIEGAAPLEGSAIAVRSVPGDATEGFVAFLDGIQRSRVVAHSGFVPLVHGAVAAAVRRRVDRRPRLWDAAHRTQSLFAPRALLDAALVEAIEAQLSLVDTGAITGKGSPAASATAATTGSAPSAPSAVHPQELAALALTAVQRAREAAELSLVAAWTTRGDGPLLVDGGISGSESGARSDRVVGVIKSHRTLYADAGSVPLVLGLREGERTTAVTLSSPRRHPVASWYLRLRDASGRAPLFGLVRVEAAITSDITARADEVSRWILAERAPVSLPDQRWDVMVYGIRECEQYLTAILR